MAQSSLSLQVWRLLPHNSFLKRLLKTGRQFVKRAKAEIFRQIAGLFYRDHQRIGPLQGTFSAYEELKAQRVTGRIVMASQNSPATIPGSVRDICKLDQNGNQPWPIFWTHHRQAHLVGPTLILLNDKNQGCLEAAYYEPCFPDDPSTFFPFHPPETHLSGNWISLISRWGDKNFYHWLHDLLPRLAVLEELPPDTQILVSEKLNPYATESLELLGLTNRIRHTKETNLFIENFYFCSPTAMTGCYNRYGIDFLRRKFLPKGNCSKPLSENFYIIRRAKTRGIINEQEVIEFFTGLGWSIVDLETLHFQEQIALFAHAKAICGFHGAGFSNLVWCQPGCKVLEIFSSTFLNGCYEGIAETTQCNYHFEIFQGDRQDRIHVPVSKLKALISKWE